MAPRGPVVATGDRCSSAGAVPGGTPHPPLFPRGAQLAYAPRGQASATPQETPSRPPTISRSVEPSMVVTRSTNFQLPSTLRSWSL